MNTSIEQKKDLWPKFVKACESQWQCGGDRYALTKVTKNGKRLYLGTFRYELAAAKEYDKAALDLFGEHAYTNQMAFPEDFETEG